MFDFFLPEHEQNDPDPYFMQQKWKNHCRNFFGSYLQAKLCHGIRLYGITTRYLASYPFLTKVCQYKKGMYFTFDFGWYSIHFEIVR